MLEFAAGVLAFKRRALDLQETQRSEPVVAYIEATVDVLLELVETGLAAGVDDARILEDSVVAVKEMSKALNMKGLVHAAAMASVLAALGEMLGMAALSSADFIPKDEPF